jgi:hypothetical protein
VLRSLLPASYSNHHLLGKSFNFVLAAIIIIIILSQLKRKFEVLLPDHT